MKTIQNLLILVFMIGCCIAFVSSGLLRSYILVTLFAKMITSVTVLALTFAIIKTNLKTVFIGFAAVCFCLSVHTTDWPLKLIFSISKSSLNSRITLQETEFGDPSWIGAIRVASFRRLEDGCWFLTKNRFDQAGFAKVETLEKLEGYRVKINLGDSWYYLVDD